MDMIVFQFILQFDHYPFMHINAILFRLSLFSDVESRSFLLHALMAGIVPLLIGVLTNWNVGGIAAFFALLCLFHYFVNNRRISNILIKIRDIISFTTYRPSPISLDANSHKFISDIAMNFLKSHRNQFSALLNECLQIGLDYLDPDGVYALSFEDFDPSQLNVKIKSVEELPSSSSSFSLRTDLQISANNFGTVFVWSNSQDDNHGKQNSTSNNTSNSQQLIGSIPLISLSFRCAMTAEFLHLHPSTSPFMESIRISLTPHHPQSTLISDVKVVLDDSSGVKCLQMDVVIKTVLSQLLLGGLDNGIEVQLHPKTSTKKVPITPKNFSLSSLYGSKIKNIRLFDKNRNHSSYNNENNHDIDSLSIKSKIAEMMRTDGQKSAHCFPVLLRIHSIDLAVNDKVILQEEKKNQSQDDQSVYGDSRASNSKRHSGFKSNHRSVDSQEQTHWKADWVRVIGWEGGLSSIPCYKTCNPNNEEANGQREIAEETKNSFSAPIELYGYIHERNKSFVIEYLSSTHQNGNKKNLPHNQNHTNNENIANNFAQDVTSTSIYQVVGFSRVLIQDASPVDLSSLEALRRIINQSWGCFKDLDIHSYTHTGIIGTSKIYIEVDREA